MTIFFNISKVKAFYPFIARFLSAMENIIKTLFHTCLI